MIRLFLMVGIFVHNALANHVQSRTTDQMPGHAAARFADTTHLRTVIKIAEEFILVNGYTDQPADTSKLVYEFIYDDEHGKAEILKRRKNTLHPKAFCISENKIEWHIGFLSAEIAVDRLTREEKTADLPGRAVIIAKDFTEIRMAHKDPLFSRFTKL